ncbi:MAG: hypothetical protein RBR78_05010 [Flavobacteriaceae bacterium]|jgi:hypothetical protein|nr:hypothetical protein [Flavobacteriaceae bacterium]
MKTFKILVFLILSGLLFSSCGPKRLGCGPYRCFNEVEKENSGKSFEQKFCSDSALS